MDNTAKRSRTHNKKRERKYKRYNRCTRGIRITEIYRAEAVDRSKTL